MAVGSVQQLSLQAIFVPFSIQLTYHPLQEGQADLTAQLRHSIFMNKWKDPFMFLSVSPRAGAS